MSTAVYGHWGFALLLFPTAGSGFLECEEHSLIGAVEHFIEAGRMKVFTVGTLNNESWLNEEADPARMGARQQDYNGYLEEEAVPFIARMTSSSTPVIAAGASLGGYQAANAFFRRPDLFGGMIAMSGTFDMKLYTGGACEADCYCNSPVDFLPDLEEGHRLRLLRSREQIHILAGRGPHECPEHSIELAGILSAKGIPHHLDLWGEDMPHDWPTWKAMLPHVIGTRL